MIVGGGDGQLDWAGVDSHWSGDLVDEHKVSMGRRINIIISQSVYVCEEVGGRKGRGRGVGVELCNQKRIE